MEEQFKSQEWEFRMKEKSVGSSTEATGRNSVQEERRSSGEMSRSG